MTVRPRALKAGIIAAGRGERLRAAAACKPLVEVGGRPLIAHVLTAFGEAGAADVTIIINAESTIVRDRVESARWPFPIRWIVETTPSSMHSFLRLVEVMAVETGSTTGASATTGGQSADAGPYLISTVDTVAPPGAFADFVSRASTHTDADVTLALTTVVDDEAPLRVRSDRDGRVIGFGGDEISAPQVTAGYYLVRPSILAEADAARADGLAALRQFLARLVERGYTVRGVSMPASLDVDRPADIRAADVFLRQAGR